MGVIAKLQSAVIVAEYETPSTSDGWTVITNLYNGSFSNSRNAEITLEAPKGYLLEVVSANVPITGFRQFTDSSSRDVTLASGQTSTTLASGAISIGLLANSSITHAVIKLTPI